MATTKAQRKPKAKSREKFQGDRKPQPDPRRVKATLAHVNQALQISLKQVHELGEQTKKSLKDLWNNESELKNGMDAAEFNLRAHQKVLNGMAIEIERISNLLHGVMGAEEPKQLEHLEMANVSLPGEDGAADRVVRRIDWPYYHKEIEKDLEILAEYERQKQAEQKARTDALRVAVDSIRTDADADDLKDMAARISTGEQLIDGFELTEAERSAVCDRLNFGPIEAKEEAHQNGEPQHDNEFPEGAVVFGGEDGVQTSDPGDTGSEDDRGEGDGSSSSSSEGSVSEEVHGIRGGEQRQAG